MRYQSLIDGRGWHLAIHADFVDFDIPRTFNDLFDDTLNVVPIISLELCRIYVKCGAYLVEL